MFREAKVILAFMPFWPGALLCVWGCRWLPPPWFGCVFWVSSGRLFPGLWLVWALWWGEGVVSQNWPEVVLGQWGRGLSPDLGILLIACSTLTSCLGGFR